MRLLFVLCLVLCSPVVALPWGIQYNMSVFDLYARGCLPCLSQLYATPTTSTNILSCAGPVLFVGVKYGWTAKLNLGAYGLASEVQTRTALNTPHLSNGVYWYFLPGQSFGFLKDNTLQQASADIGTTNPDSRLSWHLDVNGGGVSVGGYRAGSYVQLNHDTTFLKIIYNCPNELLVDEKAPSKKPAIAPTSIPATVPTSIPTNIPTSIPTNIPTQNPTYSPNYTIATAAPTTAPDWTALTVTQSMMPLDPSYVTGTTRKIFRDSVHRTIQYYLRQYSEQWFQVSEITLVKYPYRIFPDAYVEATINYTVTVRSNITENAISLLNAAIWSGQFLHTLNRYTKVFSPKNATNINTFNSNFFSAIGVPTMTPTMQPTSRPAELLLDEKAPSEKPAIAPTSVPTNVPTNIPTNVPTRTPTAVPTRTPTTDPTRMPTNVPTRMPTNIPTQNPSYTPTSTPTNMPSYTPTYYPTPNRNVPTRTPTTAPTSGWTILYGTQTIQPLDPTFAATARFQSIMSDTLKIILWRYDSISEYHVGRIAVRKNNRRSLVEVVTTEISFNITARSRLSQDIQDTLNGAIASGLFRKYLNRYGSADFYNYGSIMTVYGVFSTTDINYNIPVRNPTPRPTMRTSTVSPTKRFIDSDYPTIRPSSPVKKTDLPPQIPIHDHSSDAESYDPMNDLHITVPAIVAISVVACLLPVLLFLLIRLRARSIESNRLIAEAAQREVLDRRERIERDRAIAERIDNIASRREAERVHSILSPNTLVTNI